ncbi:type II secretion system F family protein [Coralloluteibacterium stylophorae]|uniref:Type II secretion system F family protein n=1 Tax=Coralloluteibacterium stylophorae TaxID=1776034 RepID=A0A8J7VTB6_9GAMM|nr:type II secretion system F family protein [Coralloluteibacterium stylophorae]MBS7457781.1 type II secretion system F family protein [Coralloluteibacterium stylophorae]
MPQFRYKALSGGGEPLEGQMEAASAEEVVARLQEAGHIPMEARSAEAFEGGAGLASLLRRRALDGDQILQFTQQLATLLGAGQPLDRALAILLDLPESAQARRVIERVRDSVRGGTTLSAALEQQHGLFSRLYINMVRAGEAGGSLHETLARLADYLERTKALKGSVVNALIYPAILMLMVGLSVVMLLAYVVPQFEGMFEGMGAELPLLTRITLALGDAARGWWWLGLLAIVGALLWFDRRRRDPAWRLRFDTWLLGLRGVGPLLAKMETARLAHTLATLVGNGVPLLTALNVARNVVGNRALAQALDAAAEEVKTGSGLAHALARPKLLPRLAVQMIQVGEETGELEPMLEKVATTFDRETAQAINRVLAALVPALTVVMALVVGLVVFAILVPLYDMTQSIG